MIPRSSRLAIWCIALLLCCSLYIKGRAPAAKGQGAAFLRAAPGMVKVRLAGDFPHPGLYLFPDGATVSTAIKMTLPAAPVARLPLGEGAHRLSGGDVVTLSMRRPQFPVLSVGKMTVKERMLLKIPLDPNQLAVEEWSSLPGIGPVLSARIVEDRHKNGAFSSLDSLLRVPGLGPGKLAALRPYF